MKVLIDTPIWSLAFRKKNDNVNNITIENLIEFIRSGRIAIIGPIRQEVLSGISDRNKFNEIKNKMSIFSDYEIQTSDYEFAAECSNECRRNGIQGSHTDFLICAVAIKNDWEIFTEDNDFFEYEKYIPIKIIKVRLIITVIGNKPAFFHLSHTAFILPGIAFDLVIFCHQKIRFPVMIV